MILPSWVETLQSTSSNACLTVITLPFFKYLILSAIPSTYKYLLSSVFWSILYGLYSLEGILTSAFKISWYDSAPCNISSDLTGVLVKITGVSVFSPKTVHSPIKRLKSMLNVLESPSTGSLNVKTNDSVLVSYSPLTTWFSFGKEISLTSSLTPKINLFSVSSYFNLTLANIPSFCSMIILLILQPLTVLKSAILTLLVNVLPLSSFTKLCAIVLLSLTLKFSNLVIWFLIAFISLVNAS